MFVGLAVQEIKRKVTNIEESEENNANGYALFCDSFYLLYLICKLVSSFKDRSTYM